MSTGKPPSANKVLDSKLKAQREELERRKEALLAKKAAVASYASARGIYIFNTSISLPSGLYGICLQF
jgi:hypothetical protein